MRKYAFVALILLIAPVIGGCGSSGETSSTIIDATNNSIKAPDIASYISGKTLYSISSTNGSPTSYAFGIGTTTGILTKNGTQDGFWTYSTATGEITITPSSGTMNLKRIQVESQGTTSEYWLVYDANPTTVQAYKIYRFYVDQTNGLTAANAYLTSITQPFGLTYPKVLMGGNVQGQPLSLTGTADTITVSTLAGSKANTPGNFANTSSAGSERFNHPTGVTTDGTNLYVADSANNMIRKVEIATGKTTTFAGTGIANYSDNDIGTLATFYAPQGITCDGINLYVADTGNALIRQISLTGTNKVTTLAGLAGTLSAIDSTTSGADARFYSPVGITTDGTNLYVTDTSYHTIRKIKIAKAAGTNNNYSQSVTTLAGSPGSAGSVDSTGTAARFNIPNRITTDGTNLYVTDFNNHTIRKIVIATGATITIAGTSGVGASSVDGAGSSARFYYPSGIITDGTNLFITEFNNTNSSSPNYKNLIRKMDLSTSDITTISGGSKSDLFSVDSASGVAARFSKPIDLTSNGTSLFVSNYSNGYTDSVTKIVYPDFNNIRMVGP